MTGVYWYFALGVCAFGLFSSCDSADREGTVSNLSDNADQEEPSHPSRVGDKLSPSARLAKANSLVSENRREEALEHFFFVCEAEPNHIDAHYATAQNLQRLDRMKEAERYYRKVMALSPDHVEALVQLGTVMGRQGMLDESLTLLLKAVHLEPNHPIAHANMGVSLRDQGRLEEAAACFRKALTITPGIPGLQDQLQGVLDEIEKRNETSAP